MSRWRSTRSVLSVLLVTVVTTAGLALSMSAAHAAPAASIYPSPPPTFTPVGTDPAYTPASGNNSRPLLVIVPTFTDIPTPTGFDEASIAKRIFGPNFPNLVDYYKANSFGRFKLTPAPKKCGVQDGVLVVNVGDSNTYLGQPNSPTTDEHQHRLSLDAAAPCIDFGQFDRNNDGVISTDELVIDELRVARQNSEVCGATRGIEGNPTYNGKRLTMWVAASTSATDLLTTIHETGHAAFHTKDLYGYGIGSFDLYGPTCGGGWNDQHSYELSAWQKKNLGWVPPTVVTRSGYYDIPRADTNPVSYLLYDPDKGTNDYFMVENREPTAGTYDQTASDSGLAIYRIDDTKFGSGDDAVRPIEIMRPDGTTDPGCDKVTSTCYGGNSGDAWNPADPTTPQRAMTRTWRDNTPAKVAVLAIGPAGDHMRAYFKVRGPGVLVDPYGLHPTIFPGEANDVSFPVTNTGETTDTFHFTLTNLPAGWTATTDSQTLAAGASSTAHVQLTPPLTTNADDYTVTPTGTSATDTTVTSNAPEPVTVAHRPTTLHYTGATSGDYHHQVTVSATLTDTRSGNPIADKDITFWLGLQTATVTTDATGTAFASILLNQEPGALSVTASFAGDRTYLPSDADGGTFTINREHTVVVYRGDTHVANGTPARMSATLTEDTRAPINGWTVTFTLGSGATAQTCFGSTDATGTASCTIASVSQPLSGNGALPVTASFAGDAFYLPSADTQQALLLYLAGHGIGATVNLTPPLLPPVSQAVADTGPVTTPSASSTQRSTGSLSLLGVSLTAVSSSVQTFIAPGHSDSQASVGDLSAALPGLPAVAVRGVHASSTSACRVSSGQTSIDYLAVGGQVVIGQTTVIDPNTRIIVAGITLVLNEQSTLAGADAGLHVNGLHLTVPGMADIVIGSAETDIHNCA